MGVRQLTKVKPSAWQWSPKRLSPLARPFMIGLYGIWPHWQTRKALARDYGVHRLDMSVVGNLNWAHTPVGRGTDGFSTANYYQHTSAPELKPPLSVLQVFQYDDDGTNDNYISHTSDGATNNGWRWLIRSAADDFAWEHGGVATYPYSPTVTAVDKHVYAALHTLDAENGTARLYLQDLLSNSYTTSSVSVGTINGTLGNFRFGVISTSNPISGPLVFTAIWSRVIVPAEARRLVGDPFLLLRPARAGMTSASAGTPIGTSTLIGVGR